MFPDSMRGAASTVYSSSIKGASAMYRFTRSTLWVVGTSVVILALPVVFEVERVQTEEAQLMQQRQVKFINLYLAFCWDINATLALGSEICVVYNVVITLGCLIIMMIMIITAMIIMVKLAETSYKNRILAKFKKQEFI